MTEFWQLGAVFLLWCLALAMFLALQTLEMDDGSPSGGQVSAHSGSLAAVMLQPNSLLQAQSRGLWHFTHGP